MPQNVPQNTKISWGSMAPDPLELVNSCRVAMFSTSTNNIAPPPDENGDHLTHYTLNFIFYKSF